MVVKWTDSTLVKARLKTGTSLTSAEIDEFIEQNEGWLEVWLKDTGVSVPAGIPNMTNKIHKFGRKIVEIMTVLDIIMSTPMSFRTLEEAYLAANISADQMNEFKKLLDAQGVADYVRKGGT